MTAYRARVERRERPEPRPGLVTDMVRQFADRYAFLRELVQNSIDAGATGIEVTLSRDVDGEVLTSVGDDGSGMTPAIIQNALLTLFSSSKEGDASKIGKYGVGFVSVFAVEPSSVLVETWRAEGAWTVRLAPDHDYVIEELEPRAGTGTTVTVVQAMESSDFDLHAAKSRDALARWCRHARVPIHLSVTDYANPAASQRIRVDTALAVHAAVSVTDLEDQDAIVLGPSAGSEHLPLPPEVLPYETSSAFVGFYNRGLTLYETSSESFDGLEGLRVKISSPKLGHTLSRDNVKREHHFEELVARAQRLAEKRLPKAIEDAIAAEATRLAQGGDPAPFLALLLGATERPLALGPKRVWFPLTDSVDGVRALTAALIARKRPWGEPVLTSVGPSPLTAALSERGRPVVLCPHPEVLRRLNALGGGDWRAEPAATRHVWVTELARDAQSDSDRALLAELGQVLARASAPVARVGLAEAVGASAGYLVISATPAPFLANAKDLITAARRWDQASTLLLDSRNETIAVARQRAPKSLREVAHLLSRLILLERDGAAPARVNAALLENYAAESP